MIASIPLHTVQKVTRKAMRRGKPDSLPIDKTKLAAIPLGIEKARSTISERSYLKKDPYYIPGATKVLMDYYKCRDRIEPKLIKSVRHYVSRFKQFQNIPWVSARISLK